MASARWGRCSPPTSTASTPCTGCCRGRSVRARPSSPCAPWRRWSTPGARPRSPHPPRCAPPSTPAAPPEFPAAQRARGIPDVLGPVGRAGELDGGPNGTRVTLLTGSLKAAARRGARADVAEGRAGIVIGTHALLQEGVDFADLGLVVVDEQHRFGVEQRDALRAKGNRPPHVLVMTATPIPRTVAMTVYGDLETSTLRQLPAGRGGVSSAVVPAGEKPAWLDRAWARVREEVAAGRQAYVVCPRIGDEEGSATTDDDGPGGEDGAPPAEKGSGDRRRP